MPAPPPVAPPEVPPWPDSCSSCEKKRDDETPTLTWLRSIRTRLTLKSCLIGVTFEADNQRTKTSLSSSSPHPRTDDGGGRITFDLGANNLSHKILPPPTLFSRKYCEGWNPLPPWGAPLTRSRTHYWSRSPDRRASRPDPTQGSTRGCCGRFRS